MNKKWQSSFLQRGGFMQEIDVQKIRQENKQTREYMIDMLIMLFATTIMAVFHYGVRSLLMVATSIIAAVLCEASVDLLRKRNPHRIADLSSVFTGAAIALMLPASAPMWLAPIGSVFAIAVAKLPFGNARTTPFVPAAAGFAFLTLSYRELVFTYPSVRADIKGVVTGSEGFVSGISIANMLSQKTSIGTGIINMMDLFVGKVSGPMGASCLFVMFGLFMYMLARRSSEWITSAGFLAACSILAVIFPRVLTGRSVSLVMELSSGMLFFAAIFFISDPVTSPKSQMARVIYGFVGGILTMIFRYFGEFEEGVCFVILIMNALSSYFEILGEKINNKINNKENKPENKKENKRKKVKKDAPKDERGYSL